MFDSILRFHVLLAVCLVCSFATAAEKLSTRTVTYKQVEGRELVIDLLTPTAESKSARPAIVFFHGGGWSGGNRRTFKGRAEYFAKRGAVCALVEYRLVKSREPNNPPLCCIQDAKSAMRWVRSHAKELNIDPNRIAACGSSAGGHLTAAVTLLEGLDDPQDDLKVSPKANAMLMYVPVLDNGPNDSYGHERCGPEWQKYSPAHHVTKGAPPALILAGRKDHLAQLPAMQRFEQNMKKAGARCLLNVYEGGHNALTNKKRPDVRKAGLRACDDFLVSLGWLEPLPKAVSNAG